MVTVIKQPALGVLVTAPSRHDKVKVIELSVALAKI